MYNYGLGYGDVDEDEADRLIGPKGGLAARDSTVTVRNSIIGRNGSTNPNFSDRPPVARVMRRCPPSGAGFALGAENRPPWHAEPPGTYPRKISGRKSIRPITEWPSGQSANHAAGFAKDGQFGNRGWGTPLPSIRAFPIPPDLPRPRRPLGRVILPSATWRGAGAHSRPAGPLQQMVRRPKNVRDPDLVVLLWRYHRRAEQLID